MGSSSNKLVTLGVLFFIIGGIIVWSLTVDYDAEDERETRHYGNLTCVYNVTDDVIEACNGALSTGNG